MSLSVLNNISAIYAQNYLNQTQASLQTVLQQLSSGSRINSGADDAAGLAVVNGLQANEAALQQSSQNATNGTGLLQTADGALSQVTSLLTRAITLATESANSTLNSQQVSSANQEYQTILSEIGAIGSTTNFSGNQVFTTNATNLFVSDGSVTGASSYNDTVGVLTTGSVGQSPSSVAITTAALTVAAAGTTSAASVQSTGTITPTNATDLLSGTISVGLANGAASNFSVTGVTASQFVAAFNANAAFSSQGITASVVVATGVITIKGPSNGIGGSVTFTNNALTSTTSASVADAAPVAAAGTAAVDGRSLEAITLGTSTNTLAGTLTIAVGGGTANSITVNSGTSGTTLATQINSNATFQAANVVASFNSSTGVLSIYGPSGTGQTLNLTGSTLTQTTKQTPGAGVNFNDASINTLTATSAPTILTSLTAAIADVAYQRGILGANINQLTAAAAVADTANVNLTSASNAIQATNYGKATSDLAKYEVLSQTGISALAQANTVQQEILKLLQ
ncbi:flagellin [Granulicella aggregans]|jgi:flagellin|uniref:Flagellin n=1 Tax=Granulicella aggregans TaxID=474949 RepID=A0A7W7Z9Y0_9BACT|nr:flagellin [Granulicella aggregans]MBB5056046.1 flagellin [Granulicella aggregans]